jgi:hypothetical protein
MNDEGNREKTVYHSVCEMTMATVKTIEEDFHRHLEILLQLIGLTGSNGPPGSSTTPVPPETTARRLSR